MADELRQQDYRTLAAFRHALRRFHAFSEDAARAHGLTPQQHQAILALKGHDAAEPMSVGNLAAALLIRHHSAVELVDRLVAAGLVLREGDAGDRRRVALTLTAKAEAVLAELSRTHLAELRRSGPLLAALVRRLDGD
jgi:DNA-binding MarR family transcriptional regulator